MLTISRLSAEEARLIIEGARSRANDLGVPQCIAVCDESGILIMFERMDGAKASSVAIAMDKAFVSGAARRPTRFYNERAMPGQAAYGIGTSNAGRFTTVVGGVPVTVNGVCVGGVGVSSGAPSEDEACAEAGVAHMRRVSGLEE